jgi:hypothetical protein
MERIDIYFLTIFYTLIYLGMGIYFTEKGFLNGAGAWFSLGGMIGIFLMLGIWTSHEN